VPQVLSRGSSGAIKHSSLLALDGTTEVVPFPSPFMRWLLVRISKRTSGPDHHTGLRSGPVRFRKHHRPCGQPAVEGGIESFRPLPAQAGHFTRINAMPSDLPLTSTDWAMYPVPPQRGQLFGSTPPPQLPRSLSPIRVRDATKLILLRKPNKTPVTRLQCHF
jgi:hypothetical protein